MAKISPYVSGKVKDLKVGLSSYSEGKTSLQITGNVGIGTTDPYASVGASNTSVLAVGILTANRIFSTVFGQFTGGSVVADNIVGLGLSISGISTLGKDFVVTPTSSGVGATVGGVGVVTYFGDGSQLTGIGAATTANIVAETLKVTGVSTLGVTSITDLTTFNNADVIFQGAAANQNITFDASENDLEFTDAARLKFGNSDDLEIWHSGNSHIKNDTGDLKIRSDSLILKRGDDSEAYLKATVNEDVKLYYNGNEKFATTGVGVAVSGIVTATSGIVTYYGDGSKLSNIPSLTGVSTGVGTFIASAGVSTDVDTFAYASLDYKLAEYSFHFMNGSNIQAEKLLVMQDNTTAFSNEFAIMSSSDLLVSVGATISGSNVLVQVTPETGVSGLTTYRWRREVQE